MWWVNASLRVKFRPGHNSKVIHVADVVLIESSGGQSLFGPDTLLFGQSATKLELNSQILTIEAPPPTRRLRAWPSG